VTDYKYGHNGFLRWSTAQILFAGQIGKRDVVLAYGRTDQAHEIATTDSIYSIPAGNAGNLTAFEDTENSLVLFANTLSASTFFAPMLVGSENDPFAHYWGFGTNSSVLVGGPHLVRSAALSTDGVLAIRGDLDTKIEDTRLYVIAPREITGVTWNGKSVVNMTSRTTVVASGIFVGRLQTSNVAQEISVPKLDQWHFMDSLPEISPAFDESSWIVANRTTTNAFLPMEYGDGRVLYGCDYGLYVALLCHRGYSADECKLLHSCENIVLWRGHFTATGIETSVKLLINGGEGMINRFECILDT
jgi:hypothetical protein